MSYDSDTYLLDPIGTDEFTDSDALLTDTVQMAVTVPVVDSWIDGVEPECRREDTQPCSGAVAVLITLLALVALGAPQLRRLMSNLATDLLGVRRRNNAFDSHTVSERRTLGLSILLGCVCQGILLGVAINPAAVSNGPLLLAITSLAIVYYLFQLVAYSVIGYTFSDGINTSQWLKGFNLSQGVLGLALALPAITILYYHTVTVSLLVVSLILYLLARIACICKGFRIFYHRLPSLVYFILYLCALEIIPVISVFAIARMLDALL